MKILDLHTHILPAVDDGAADMDRALEMLRNSISCDIAAVVVTPHCNVPNTFDNYRSEALTRRFEELKQAASDLPIDLYLGAEVHVTEQLPDLLQENRLQTINNGRYLLTEFAARCPAEDFEPALDCILDAGYIPLIAHPERYQAVCHSPQMVREWLDKGCHLQLTGGSIAGDFGRTVQKTADYLLKNDLVCCVASDAHGITRRSNFLTYAYDRLALYFGNRYANILMWENPLRICNDEDL